MMKINGKKQVEIFFSHMAVSYTHLDVYKRQTIYFNDHAFQKYNGGYSNYVDIENGDEYWISGLKKRESNRHWDGHGKIMIDRRAVNEYLTLIGEKELPLNLFEIIDIENRFPVERVNNLLNDKE